MRIHFLKKLYNSVKKLAQGDHEGVFFGPAGPYGPRVGVYGVPFGYPEMSLYIPGGYPIDPYYSLLT